MDFFSALYGDATGYVVLSLRDENGSLNKEKYFHWPEDSGRMNLFVEEHKNEDVYCSVTTYKSRKRLGINADQGLCVYADADTCAPDRFRLSPSIIVKTNPDRYHCYWMLDELQDAQLLAKLAKKVYKAHEDQGCDSGWAAGKMLRVPETLNTKNSSIPYRVQVSFTGSLYSLEEFEKAYEDVKILDVQTIDKTIPLDLPILEDVLAKLPEAIFNLYIDPVPMGNSWSERAYRLECDMFREGFTAEEVFVVMRNASCNKYRPEFAGMTTETGVVIPHRNDPDGVLWKEVLKSEAEVAQGAVVFTEHDDSPEAYITRYQFLNDAEREMVNQQHTFVEEFTDYVLSRSPDAAPTYARTMAYVLMSCIYGKYGYIKPKYGEAHLNIWALVLGDSTTTHKTAVYRIFLSILHEYEKFRGNGEEIDVASDFTPEALTKALGERDKQSVLLHKDEIQGWFKEIYGKSYLTNLTQTLTQLYDGKVEQTLRADQSKSQRVRADVSLSFLGIGIAKDIPEILTAKNFRDGFLTRFVWCVGKTPKIKPEMFEGEEAPIEQEEVFGFNKEVHSYAKDFTTRVRPWMENYPRRIYITEEALGRWNEFNRTYGVKISEMKNSEHLLSSFIRLGITIRKCAALLAMHEGKDTVELKHILIAMYQAEFWFNDLVGIVSSISSSDFGRKVDDVYIFILSKNKPVLKSTIYKNFGAFRPRDVDEWLNSLTAQGKIVYDMKSQKYEAVDTYE